MAHNFYTDVIQKDHRFNSVQPVTDLELLEPVTRTAVDAIIQAAASLGHRLVPVETYRSVDRQKHLYATGATQLRDVGVHHYGLACDLALEDGGKYDPHGQDYTFLRTLAEQHGLLSGIDWGLPGQSHTFRDYDHVQRIAELRQPALFASTWYPDALYRPLNDLGRKTITPLGAPLVVSEK